MKNFGLTERELEIAKDTLNAGIRYTKRHCKGIGLSYPTGKDMKSAAVANLRYRGCIIPKFEQFFNQFI